MSIADVNDMPMKIPAEILLKLSRQDLKSARQEIGALKAYIDELEDTILSLKKRINELEDPNNCFSKEEKREILKEIRAQEEFAAISKSLPRMQSKISTYRNIIGELQYRIGQGKIMTELQFEWLSGQISHLLTLEGVE